MQKRLLLFVVVAFLAANFGTMPVKAEAELGIIYYVMADDPVIFGDGRREMIEAELFAGNPKVKIITEISEWPNGDANGSWLNWTRSQWASWQQSNPTETARLRYVYNTQSTSTSKFEQTVAEKLDKSKIGNIKDNIVNLMKWVHTNHRAKKYILLVGAHGSGSAWKIGTTDVAGLASGINALHDVKNLPQIVTTEATTTTANSGVKDKVDKYAQQILGPGELSTAVSNLIMNIYNAIKKDKPSTTFGGNTEEREDSGEPLADRLGVIAFDACLMQTAGVAYELAPTIEKMVACSISMIGMSFKQMIASLIADRTVRPSDITTVAKINDILKEFSDNSNYSITNAKIANHILNAMYEHGDRNLNESYIASVSDTKLIKDRMTDNSKDLAKMLGNFAQTFLTEAGANEETMNKYMNALHQATTNTQRYDMSFNMYADMVEFFELLKDSATLSTNIKNQAQQLYNLTKTSNVDAEEISENNKSLVARVRKKDGSGFKLTDAHGLSILFPFYKVQAVLKTPTTGGDNPVEITNPSDIKTWVQVAAQQGKVNEIIGVAASPADVRYEILRFEALKINTASTEGGKKWADLIKEYWSWAGANIETADAPEINLYIRDGSNLVEFGYIWNAGILANGFGFGIGNMKGYFFAN